MSLFSLLISLQNMSETKSQIIYIYKRLSQINSNLAEILVSIRSTYHQRREIKKIPVLFTDTYLLDKIIKKITITFVSVLDQRNPARRDYGLSGLSVIGSVYIFPTLPCIPNQTFLFSPVNLYFR